MNRALIGVPVLALAATCIAGLARALPTRPPGVAVAAAHSAPLLPAVERHRYHSRDRHAADPVPLSAPAAADPGGVKPGQWEFTRRLEAFAKRPPATGTQSPQTQSLQATQSLSGGDTTYLSCIQTDKAVPVEIGPQCKLGSGERQGSRITWSMICTNPQGAVRSDGVAQYHGDTMDATMINHFPAANGTVTDLTQRITGRYLGPCPQLAEAPPTSPRPTAPLDASSGSAAQWVEPPAASAGAKPSAPQPRAASARAAASTAADAAQPAIASTSAAAPDAAQPPAASAGAAPSATTGESAAPVEPRRPPRTRSAHHRRHLYHRYYSGGVSPGGGGFLGLPIRIPFLGGL